MKKTFIDKHLVDFFFLEMCIVMKFFLFEPNIKTLEKDDHSFDVF